MATPQTFPFILKGWQAKPDGVVGGDGWVITKIDLSNDKEGLVTKTNKVAAQPNYPVRYAATTQWWPRPF